MPDQPRVSITLLTNPVMQEHVARVVALWASAFPDAEINLSPMRAYPTRAELVEIRNHAVAMGAERLIIAAAHQVPLTRTGALALLPAAGQAVVLRSSPVLMGMDLTTYRSLKEPDDYVARAFCTSCGLLLTKPSIDVKRVSVSQHPTDTHMPLDFIEIIFTVPAGRYVATADVTHQAGLAGFINALPETL